MDNVIKKSQHRLLPIGGPRHPTAIETKHNQMLFLRRFTETFWDIATLECHSGPSDFTMKCYAAGLKLVEYLNNPKTGDDLTDL